MYCGYCGHEMPDNAEFCPGCGRKRLATTGDNSRTPTVAQMQPESSRPSPAAPPGYQAATIQSDSATGKKSSSAGWIMSAIAIAIIFSCFVMFMQTAHSSGTTANNSSKSASAASASSASSASSSTDQYTGVAPWGYYRDKLSSDQKKAYDALFKGIEMDKTTIDIPSISKDDVSTAYKTLMKDHPEYFWLDGHYHTHSKSDKVTSLDPTWNTDTTTRNSERAAIEAKADSAIATSKGASTYAKVKSAYEFIILNTEYDQTKARPNCRNLRGVFLEGTAVCGGYAKAFQYLMHREGITCAYVTGDIIGREDSSHAWNLVNIDGVNTQVDCTWGDPTFTENSNMKSNISYNYLCVTDSEIKRSRTFDNSELLPACTNTTYDYYARAGCYFENYKGNSMVSFLSGRRRTGETSTSIKFSNAKSYNAAVSDVRDNQAFTDRMDCSFSYNYDDEMYIITFYW